MNRLQKRIEELDKQIKTFSNKKLGEYGQTCMLLGEKATLENILKQYFKEVKRCNNCEHLSELENMLDRKRYGAFLWCPYGKVEASNLRVNCKGHDLKEGSKKLYEEVK